MAHLARVSLYNDTIAAIATPLGVGGVGIIRISGDRALEALHLLMPSLSEPIQPRYVYTSDILHPITKTKLDYGCAIFFKGPHSYTGEDVLEFQVHGNPVILRLILSALLDITIRLANAGEFTKRAFINGKLNLTQVEAIGDLIHAENESSHAVALAHLTGALYETITTMRSDLMRLLEQMEGSIDFPEEVDALDRETLYSTTENLMKRLRRIINLQDYGKHIYSGIKCVIIGKPNVGKSSLLNRLIGENRAIVSTIPGTTRDFIEIKLSLGGLTYELIDTAGLRISQDAIEQRGIRKVQTWIKKADHLLWILDGSRLFDNEDQAIFKKLKRKKNVLMVINKTDKKTRLLIPPLVRNKQWPFVFINTKEADHTYPLTDWLHATYSMQTSPQNLDLLCNVRQINCLKRTANNVQNLITQAHAGFEDAMLVIDIKSAILCLGELTGDEITEEVLDGVFSRFCVGK